MVVELSSVQVEDVKNPHSGPSTALTTNSTFNYGRDILRSEADLAKGPRGQMVKKYLNDKGFKVLAALDSVAKETSSTPGRVALAWVLAQPGIVAPIASATSLPQLEDLFAATRLTLEADSLRRLDEASRG